MSDDTPPPRPPEAPKKPTTKTSTVPLKKETVRITLRSKPGEGVVAPSDETQATPPPPATGGAPPAPAPPMPGGVAPAPPAGGDMHKTQKVTVSAAGAAGAAAVGAAAAAATDVGAPTVKLDRTPEAPATPGATQQLPRATVQLQRTQPLRTGPGGTGASGPAASQQLQGTTTSQLRASQAAGPSKMLLPLTILCGLLSLGVLAMALLATEKPFKGKPNTYGFLVPPDQPYTAKIPAVITDEAPPKGEPIGLEGLSDEPVSADGDDAGAADGAAAGGADADAGVEIPDPADEAL